MRDTQADPAATPFALRLCAAWKRGTFDFPSRADSFAPTRKRNVPGRGMQMRMNAPMRLWGAGVLNLNLDLLACYAAGVPLVAARAQAASTARRDLPSTLPRA